MTFTPRLKAMEEEEMGSSNAILGPTPKSADTGTAPSALAVLLARVEAAEGPTNRALDLLVAEALGWSQRKVTGLGLNGRTPGRWLWFAPYPNNARPRAIPAFSGPRHRAQTAALLKAKMAEAASPADR